MQSVLARKVQRARRLGQVARHTPDVYNAPLFLSLGPVPYGQLAHTDRRHEIHVEDGVVPKFAVGLVARCRVRVRRRARRLPEAGPRRVVQSRAGDDDVEGWKGSERSVEKR